MYNEGIWPSYIIHAYGTVIIILLVGRMSTALKADIMTSLAALQ